MGDYENVMAEVRAAHGVREITDGCARTIASLYHSGQASVSYSFASTGAIPDTADDLWRDLWPDTDAMTADERLMLDMLGTYCLSRADRGPVPGWSRLWVA